MSQEGTAARDPTPAAMPHVQSFAAVATRDTAGSSVEDERQQLRLVKMSSAMVQSL